MAQKSPPSGAPTSAAAASIAVTPGSTRISSPRQAGSPLSTASKTADAMANTPGSPPETTTTCRPCAARESACMRPLEFDPVIGGVPALIARHRHTIEIGSVADEVRGLRERRRCRRRHEVGFARSGADDHQRAGHSRRPWPGIRIIAK